MALCFFFSLLPLSAQCFIEAVLRHAGENVHLARSSVSSCKEGMIPLISRRGRSDRMVFCCSGSILRAAEPCVCLRACSCCCVGACTRTHWSVINSCCCCCCSTLGLRAPSNTLKKKKKEQKSWMIGPFLEKRGSWKPEEIARNIGWGRDVKGKRPC